MMRLLFPNNFITRLIKDSVSPEISKIIEFKQSSLLISELLKDKNAAALIPTTDLIKHKELLVSKNIGLSFDGSLCNSYLYFSSTERKLNEIYLSGDVSTLEALLVKILFKELYNIDTGIKLIASFKENQDKNILLVGDANFKNDLLIKGLSFSDEVHEIISFPFVNFVLASAEKKNIKEIENNLGNVENKFYDLIETGNIDPAFSESAIEYIKKNVSSVVLNLDSNDIEGINQLIRLPYYYGMVEEIIELKLV